jgi:hypothetical protein
LFFFTSFAVNIFLLYVDHMESRLLSALFHFPANLFGDVSS